MRYFAALASLAFLAGCTSDRPEEEIVCYDWNTWYLDEDGDGYGVEDQIRCSYSQPEGYAAKAGDCCPTDARVNPGAEYQFEQHTCFGAPSWDHDCDDHIQYEMGQIEREVFRGCDTCWTGGWYEYVPACGQFGTFLRCWCDDGTVTGDGPDPPPSDRLPWTDSAVIDVVFQDLLGCR